MKTIGSFADFIEVMEQAGFAMAGDNAEGIFSPSQFYSKDIAWHTDKAETDPWIWRIRGVSEVQGLYYGKVFLKKAGWITKEWYPYFIAVRRGAKTLEELYSAGQISHMEKEIYTLISEMGPMSTHDMKAAMQIDKTQKYAFDSAITGLQMKLFLTIGGQTRKESFAGGAYGWPTTVFCNVDSYVGEELMREAGKITLKEAKEKIASQILQINPDATPKKIERFIG